MPSSNKGKNDSASRKRGAFGGSGFSKARATSSRLTSAGAGFPDALAPIPDARDHVVDVAHFDLRLTERSGQAFRWVDLSDARAEGPAADESGEGVVVPAVAASAYRIPACGLTADVWQERATGRVHVVCPDADVGFWAHYLALDKDYAPIVAAIGAADERLERMVRQADGVRVLRQPLFETVATFMVSQNNNIPRIRNNVRRMCGGPLAPFPTPEGLVERLRADDCGLGYRRDPIRVMAEGWDGLAARLGGDYKSDKDALMGVRGIGPKVADCICLFALGHVEAYPVDTWMRKADARYHLPLVPGLEGVEQQFVFTWMRLFGDEGRS